MRFQFQRLSVWREKHIDSLSKHADNYRIWANVLDSFPYPYSRRDAEQWIAYNKALKPAQNLAILLNGQVVGGIGLSLQEGNFVACADLGYWVAEAYWNQGVATKAIKSFTDYAFRYFPELQRIEASVAAYNLASMRVLQKCSFGLEGIQRQKFLKNGELHDLHLYALLRKP